MQSYRETDTPEVTALVPADQYEAAFWQKWRTQLHLVLHKPWLAATWLKQSRTLFQRFNRIYSHLCDQPRPVRRRLQRQLGATLAGAALALALANSPVQAADIAVDGATCNLVDAITAANNDAATGGCVAGDGSDTITLGAHVTLTDTNHTDGAAAFGLPPITSTMTINGNGFTIARDGGAPNFGFFRILSPDGNLSLNSVTLTGSNHAGSAIDNRGFMALNNSTLSGNTSSTKGGAIDNQGLMTLNNNTISGNTATDDGGAILNRNTMTLHNSTLSGNTVLGDDGGAIYNNAGAKLYVHSSIFSDNTANNGGAIYNNTGGFVFLSTSTLISNTTTTSTGGAIYNYEGTVTVSESTLSGNNASQKGGAIYNAQGTLTVNNSTLSGNTAATQGGGIYNSGTLTVTKTLLSGNSGEFGGAIYSNQNGTLTVENSTLRGNSATSSGGGIQVYGGQATVNNSTLSGNSAPDGAGIYNYYGTTTLNNSTISGNSATNSGGGIYNYSDSTLVLNRSLISGNSASGGPEIYNASSGTITAASYNLFGYGGDARSVNFTPSGSDIVPSEALDEILVTTLADNPNPWAYTGPTTWSHALVSGSPAIDAAGTSGLSTDQRGVVRPQGAADDIGAFEALPFNVTLNGAPCNLIEAIITANTAARHSSCAAGTPGADTITLTDNITLMYALADGDNGDTLKYGLPVITSTITIEGAGLTLDRHPDGDELGFFLTAPGSALTLNDITLTGALSIFGAVFGTGEVTINDSTVTGNLGLLNGGVLSKYGQATINGSTFTNNTSLKYSGALFLVSPTTITDSTISYNNGRAGGGIVSGYALTVTNSLISQNTTKYNGGGILNLNNGSVTLTGSTISNNVAQAYGGGLYNKGGHVTVTNSTISGNSSTASGGGLMSVPSSPDVSARGNKPTMSAAVMEKLQARGIDAAQVEAWKAAATQLKARWAGAASRQARPPETQTIALINSTVSGNTAGGGGGALYNLYGEATITHSTLVGNSAISGGSLFNITGTVTLNGALISGNTASSNGGEIYGDAVSAGVNLLGDSSKSNSEAFYNFTPGASDITATSDGTMPTAVDKILNPTLADNGGDTLTHALVSVSPALNGAGDGGLDTDQRGTARPQGSADDIGAVEMPVATITIALDGRPNHPVNLGFTSSNLGNFLLDDPAADDGDAYSNSRTFNVLPGAFNVRRNNAVSWFTTDIACTPTANATINLPNRRASITVAADEAVTCTFTVDRAVQITARAFNDIVRNNANLGKRNAGDPWLEGWTMSAATNPTTTVASGVTAATATPGLNEITFDNLHPGTYTVCTVLPDGSWTPTTPTAVDPNFAKYCKPVTLTPGQRAITLFGAYQAGVVASDTFSPEEEMITDEDTIIDLPYDPAEDETVDETATEEDGLLRTYLPLVER